MDFPVSLIFQPSKYLWLQITVIVDAPGAPGKVHNPVDCGDRPSCDCRRLGLYGTTRGEPLARTSRNPQNQMVEKSLLFHR